MVKISISLLTNPCLTLILKAECWIVPHNFLLLIPITIASLTSSNIDTGKQFTQTSILQSEPCESALACVSSLIDVSGAMKVQGPTYSKPITGLGP